MNQIWKKWQAISTLLCASALAGCVFESEDLSAVDLRGSVGDGPIISANVAVYSAANEILAVTRSNSFAGYDLHVDANKDDYPLVIEVTGGVDLVTNLPPEFPMLSVVLGGGDVVTNINPYSALVVATAKQMDGGLTQGNVEAATQAVVDEFNAGLITLNESNPIWTPIDDSNLAEIVRASEALAEVLKRINARMIGVTGESTVGAIIETLAADMADGLLDGAGQAGTDGRTTAIAVLTNAQVMLETLINDLHVDGRSATTRLDAVIRSLAGTEDPIVTGDLLLTDGLIAAAQRGVNAALELESNAQLLALESQLQRLDSDMTSTEASQIISQASLQSLGASLNRVAAGLDSDIDKVLKGAKDSRGQRPNEPDSTSDTPTLAPAPEPEPTTTEPTPVPEPEPTTTEPTPVPEPEPTVAEPTPVPEPEPTVAEPTPVPEPDPAPTPEEPANSAPQISGTPARLITVGDQYAFTPDVFDPDNDELSFSLEGAPSWTRLNPADGSITGTPTTNDIGTTSGIALTVSDGLLSATLGPFRITVEEPAPAPLPNSAPEISGNPPTSVSVGSSYNFQPDARDADQDELIFEIDNRPQWLIFDTLTGSLSGIPSSDDVGVHTGIVIRVTDRVDSASLGPFSITVEAPEPAPAAPEPTPTEPEPAPQPEPQPEPQPTLGSATLSWLPPTQNSDDSTLLDLAGYFVYWGEDPDHFSNFALLDNPGLTTYIVENLPSGTYHFAVTAYNSAGIESELSNMATKTIP